MLIVSFNNVVVLFHIRRANNGVLSFRGPKGGTLASLGSVGYYDDGLLESVLVSRDTYTYRTAVMIIFIIAIKLAMLQYG